MSGFRVVATITVPSRKASPGPNWRSGGPPAAIEVPATLQDSLEARLDRLGPAKEVAQIGAVIGRDFGFDLLSGIASIENETVLAALDELVRSGLATVRGEPPGAIYTFRQGLVQDTPYGSLLRNRRTQLHARIARILEQDFPETVRSRPEVLAHHFSEAGSIEDGIEYWLKAGQASMSRSAMSEGIAHITKGLDIVRGLPEGDLRNNHEISLNLTL